MFEKVKINKKEAGVGPFFFKKVDIMEYQYIVDLLTLIFYVKLRRVTMSGLNFLGARS